LDNLLFFTYVNIFNNYIILKVNKLHHFSELTNIERAAKRSQTICILAVPATMTCSDLLSFIAACHDDIKHVRIIKDGSPNQYMALITFRSPVSFILILEMK
jgi:BRCA1-associated protein